MAGNAILAVSFGTSHADTREKTIDRIEEDIQKAYPDDKVYRAWTSKMIIKKIWNRDGVKIFNVKEAMEQMKADGIKNVLVQPTHVINGIENDLMQEDVKAYADAFESISFGTPLLTTEEDNIRVAKAVAEDLQPGKENALVLMGHGSEPLRQFRVCSPGLPLQRHGI